MLYILYFIVGGSIMVLALLLSQSKYLFLSGIITALPILTLINMGMQMKNMKEDTFHSVLQNTVFGAVGMLLFTVLAFLLTNWFKPSISIMSALAVYAVFMISGKYIMSMFA
ncbi:MULTISPECIES: hypothetical protein [unclassified Lysinibacillus]|uniref:hypothetical protein n=1 Tax=unclassified Lysinibacillus TaxID=2636778 RepID=UPI0025553333|nr:MULTISPECIES: hypothetical protein [unclassified Lysinibacillus]MDM5248178.1 hypothetical protein [Lysinibacillus sp. G4S2]